MAHADAREQVILVDDQDRVLGSAGKLDAHRDGRLHRAFSILVFDPRGRLLLQRRAATKYHFATLWSNTCCGHPRPGEATAAAARRRLDEELGLRSPLAERTQLIYRAEDQTSGLIEHELLHVFFGTFVGEPDPNPSEVGAWRWMSVPRVQQAIARQPAWFTPWFKLLMDRLFPIGVEVEHGR
jgi:isopentenyl-diphosphate delta-isomerase